MREIKFRVWADTNHLIGKCFKPNDHTYFMIRSIREVCKSDITVEGLAIHTHLKDRQTPMKFDAFSFITEADLKELEIPREKFSREFDKVVEQIKRNIGI